MQPHPRSIVILSDRLEFPPVTHANADGLLAVGGDLSPDRLRLAYCRGIFPWFSDDSFILWWSPDPRMVLFPAALIVSKSMRKVLREKRFRVSRNSCFEKVIRACAKVGRKGQPGTWITPHMQDAYIALHKTGWAVSYEVWEGDQLVGGLYGIDLGHIFCGESMFSMADNASKFALIHLVRDLGDKKYILVDCQVYTPHLESLGAELIPREMYLKYLKGNHQASQCK